MKNNSNQTNDADIENQLIGIITTAEKEAFESTEKSIDFSLYKIDSNNFNDKSYRELLAQSIKSAQDEYANTNNLYKYLNDIFYLTNNFKGASDLNKMDNSFRIESIAETALGLLTCDNLELKTQALEFFKNPYDIVLKTRRLEVKKMFYLGLLRSLKKTIKKTSEVEPFEIRQIQVNPYPAIFKNKGYKVFERMHDNYKDKSNPVANYSFLYYAMQHDELIHCGGAEFIDFLATKDVSLDRIDSRQSGHNKRKDYYDEIKDSAIKAQD